MGLTTFSCQVVVWATQVFITRSNCWSLLLMQLRETIVPPLTGARVQLTRQWRIIEQGEQLMSKLWCKKWVLGKPRTRKRNKITDYVITSRLTVTSWVFWIEKSLAWDVMNKLFFHSILPLKLSASFPFTSLSVALQSILFCILCLPGHYTAALWASISLAEAELCFSNAFIMPT